jgi:hypothetical protein
MNKLRTILFVGILAALLIPLIEYEFQIVKTGPVIDLVGAIIPAKDTVLAIDSWMSGKFQAKKEEYLNENFGFRTIGVRINNQIAYSLFNKTKANSVEVGKNNFLFEKKYIEAALGVDFIGDSAISERLRKLKFIHDTLEKMGKQLILVYAAGKGSFYAEYYPEKYKGIRKSRTNYEAFIKRTKEMKINHIDFHKYFNDNKTKSPYPLYPQHGIHWSIYGACVAADSIIKFVEKNRNIDMPEFYWKEVMVETAKDMDYDIGAGMNLLIQFKRGKMGYPLIILGNEKNKNKPSLLIVSDSFYFALLQQDFDKCFSNHQFWYYNERVFSEEISDKVYQETSKMDLTKEINDHEIFIIMASEHNLPKLGWGYIERMYDHFTKGKN